MIADSVNSGNETKAEYISKQPDLWVPNKYSNDEFEKFCSLLNQNKYSSGIEIRYSEKKKNI